MKFGLMKLIWKSADLSSTLRDPDSRMEMSSQTDALYLCGSTLFVREQAGIVIFPLSENEEPRLDAHSLRGMEI